MSGEPQDTARAPSVVERFVKQLVVTFKAVSLYPPSSAIPRDNAENAVAVLREVLGESPEVRLSVAKAGIAYEGIPLFAGQSAFRAIATELYHRNVADVRFHSGTKSSDLIAFLSLLLVEPEELVAGGGFEARLWEQGVDAITVTEAQIAFVERATEPGEESVEHRYGVDELDEMVASALAGSSRDRAAIASFMSDPESIGAYLSAPKAGEEHASVTTVGGRVADLARIALDAPPEESHELMRSLAVATLGLEPNLRRSLLTERLLPEARTDDAAAALVREMDLDEVCAALVEGEEIGQRSHDGLARAIRNLAMISLVERDDVANAAGAAMRGAGMADGEVEDVISSAMSNQITVHEAATKVTAQDKPAETVLRLMEVAAASGAARANEHDTGLQDLAREARRGVSDADVLAALVSLAGLDARPEPFAKTMSLLEDSIELLVSRGDIDIAADAAIALRAAAENDALSSDQQKRILDALDQFARPGDVRGLVAALRLYEPGQPEYDASHRLLDTLGDRAIEPLLEVLADEPDMTTRKSMIDIVSHMAAEHIDELGSRMSDRRWYFVRNIVLILGSTRQPAILPYLQRTLRHPEPRVRRETIRALAGVGDARAVEMLVAALEDEDAQNVQLAARYLGMTEVTTAIPQLALVARGEGRGNRDVGPRVEAIEALGKIGSVDALPTLRGLVGRRGLIGGGRNKELKAAAEGAINRIERGGAS